MNEIMNRARRAAVTAWQAMREIVGDAAYENYLRSVRRSAAGRRENCAVLSEREFYLDSLKRRYSRISRCC